jgi:DNA replicative helicase MCM subunit Mcm2 (Cdc46/Mcm family)
MSEKIQNTLLQVLQEGEMTIGNFDIRFDIDTIFISTMNGSDIAGIETMSQALWDRLERVTIPYPNEKDELKILKRYGAKIVETPDGIIEKIISICQTTRKDEQLERPAGPRSSLALNDISQSFARLRDSAIVNEEDLSNAMDVALSGRVIPSSDSQYFNDHSGYIDSLKKSI